MPETEVVRVATAGPAISVRQHRGGEPALLALHGLSANARWWDLVARRLVPRQRVLAPDLRGHGLSDKPEAGYGFEAVVADLCSVIARLHPDPLVVAGHSWGAWVALALAGAHPEHVSGVVCVDGGFADVRRHFGDSWTQAETAMRPPDLRGVGEEAIAAWIEAAGLADESDSQTVTEIVLGNFEPHGDGPGLRPRLTLDRHMQIARALFDADSAGWLRCIRCPVLLLPATAGVVEAAEKRAAVDRALELLGDRGSVTWIEGGHDLPVQRPVEVAAAIARFSERPAAALT